jgi:hypothetical protein
MARELQASLACVVTGTPEIVDLKAISGREGKEVISQGRNLSIFQQKALRVRRVYDEPRKTLIYIAYSTRMTSASDEGGVSTGRYKCAARPLPVAWLAVLLSVALRHAILNATCLKMPPRFRWLCDGSSSLPCLRHSCNCHLIVTQLSG